MESKLEESTPPPGQTAAEGTDEKRLASEGEVEGQPMSKRKRKFIAKKALWEERKKEVRKAERERRKQRIREKKARGEVVVSRKSYRNSMTDSGCNIHVAIDCSFDEYMTFPDVKKLVKQMNRSYGRNRRAANPLQLHMVLPGPKTNRRMDEMGESKNWDVHLHACSLREAFPTQRVVYLSSESPNVLSELSSDAVYVIGGLVDHNHHKGLCYRLACEGGMEHAQLPIKDYLEMKTRHVLTVDHVCAILLRWTETKDWLQAFMSILPQRKMAAPKESVGENSGEGKEGEEDLHVNLGEEERSSGEEERSRGEEGEEGKKEEEESGDKVEVRETKEEERGEEEVQDAIGVAGDSLEACVDCSESRGTSKS